MTKDGGPVVIENLEVVPGQDESLSVLIPLHGGDLAREPSQVEVNADVEVLTDQLIEELGAGADEWQATFTGGYELTSSLVQPADQWQVTGITRVTNEETRIVFGRRGLDEVGINLATASLGGVNYGDTIIGPELIWRSGGFLGLGKARVEFVPDPDPPAPVPVMVPIWRLHRPRPEGCVASYTTERGDRQGADMTVEVLGIGAGAGFKIDVSVTDEYIAREACVETVIPAKYQLLPGKTLVNGTEVSYGFRAKLFEADPNKMDTRRVPQADDDCERSYSEVVKLVHYPWGLGRLPKVDTRNWTMDFGQETHGRLSIGLAMNGAVPFKLGVDYQRSTHQRTTLKTTLIPGTDYVAYAPRSRANLASGEQAKKLLEKELEICWTTQLPSSD
ncbi:hypothetical protein SKC41_24970 [Mycobacterium sp. 050128]|uniref:hypothetical protein n=1 Tax=Mycobacterium sp. 050128 TaxID=3096112 RepID=UPI002ED89909